MSLHAASRRAYYGLINGRLLQNRAHGNMPEIKVAYPVEVPEQDLAKRKSMYELIEEPNLLEFLTASEKHAALFREL